MNNVKNKNEIGRNKLFYTEEVTLSGKFRASALLLTEINTYVLGNFSS